MAIEVDTSSLHRRACGSGRAVGGEDRRARVGVGGLAAEIERLSVRLDELVPAVPSHQIGALGEGQRRGEELGRLVSELALLREESDARFGEIASAEAATARVSADELAALAAALRGCRGHEERAVARDRELTEQVERLSRPSGRACGRRAHRSVGGSDRCSGRCPASRRRDSRAPLDRPLRWHRNGPRRRRVRPISPRIRREPFPRRRAEAQEAQEALAHRVAVGHSKRHESATGTSHSRYSSRPSVEGWRFSTSCCPAGAPSAAASGPRSAASACSGSCVVCLRAATVAELPRPGRFGVAPNVAVDGWRSPRPAQPSCTRPVRVLSSHPGRSEDAGISRLSPPRSSPPASRGRTQTSSRSSPAIAIAS